MDFSPQQDAALKAVSAWLKDRRPQTFYLAGYAGTGKSTLARHIAEGVDGPVVYGAFTGKAALVMQTKGCDGAATIHSLIYRIKDKRKAVPEFVLNPDSAVATADLVIIDECSMVDEKLGSDLLSFGTKVLVLGDPAQLPPVGGEGFFTANRPDFMLTEVHRQAQDNPIIRMSMDVREGRGLKPGSYGNSRVITRAEINSEIVLSADQVLVGKNRTRRDYNARIRQLLGFSGMFQPKDRVVCLRNKHAKGLLNGGIWNVDEVREQDADETTMVISPLDSGAVKMPQLVRAHHAYCTGRENDIDWREARHFDQFDFAYALTCHKAQGSQWDHVAIFDESATFRDDADRWLYTAITRAAEKVTVVQ